MSVIRLSAFVAMACLLAGARAEAPHTPQEWRNAAVSDIESAYQLTLENHPGAYDTANPAFKSNLSEARSAGLALAEQVSDSAGYVAALQRFNTGIHDGHAGVSTSLGDSEKPARWPGFLTAWRSGGLYVSRTEAGGPALGSRVLACDGQPINTVIQNNVFAFRGHGEVAGHWWVYARNVFYERGNPFVRSPVSCEFELHGKQQVRQLVWSAAPAQAVKWHDEDYNGITLPVGLTEPRRRLLWIAMPTYQPDEAQQAAYHALSKDLREHRERLLTADAVVIDLRDNQGGSSFWSDELAQALWGKGRVERRVHKQEAAMQVWWRASAANTAHVRQIADLTKAREGEAAGAEMKALASAMEEARTKGEPFFVEKSPASYGQANADVDQQEDPAPFTRPVYVIVPGQCASACLDALDVFKLFPNTKLVGAPSAADSTYMEVRTQALDSGLAWAIIPVKVYVNRPRAAGQFYQPDIYLNELAWSTENFQKLIEKDLARNRKQPALKPQS